MLAFAVAILSIGIDGTDAANRDYISYWAAGQQLIHHHNPYDPAEIARLEKMAGWNKPRTLFVRNAPSALFLTMPLGFVTNPRTGAILWSLAMIASLMASIRLLKTFYGDTNGSVHLYCYLFAPVLACILAGQTGIFILLGVVLFLRFHQTSPFVGGAALLICAMKPHLLLPFGIALLLWAGTTKAYRLLTGAAVAIFASCAVCLWFDPHVWNHYSQMIGSESIGDEFIPTFSRMVRIAIHKEWLWPQFLPAAVASLWAVFYYQKHRHEWSWRSHGQIVLMISVLAAPYAWVTDEVVALPAILGSLLVAESRKVSLMPFIVFNGIAMLEVMFGVKTNSGFYVWTTTVWLMWYLYARGETRVEVPSVA